MSFNRKYIQGLLCLFIILFLSSKAIAFERKDSLALNHFLMAVLDERLGDFDSAIDEYKKALKQDYNNAIIHINLASAYLRKNQVEKAIEELDLAVKLDPETVEAHAVLALLYFSQNKLEEAAYEYEIALKNASILEPRNTDIYKNLGIIYLRQKKYDLAQEVYRKVIGITPDDSEAYYYLGNALDQLNKRREAYKFFEKAIELKPDYADALNYLGYLYAEENIKLDKAEELIKMALALQPNNGAYVDSLGWVYFRKEKYQDSVQELERASRLAQDPVIFDHLGDAYFKINDRVKAKINWEKALELDASLSKVSNKIKELTKVKK